MSKVSVIVPVYNVECYIRKCLDSAIRQTLEDIEIICVDDGSTDNCPQILDDYAAKDHRIKVIHKPNGGYGQAMNIGMSQATGEYIAILESDDMIDCQMYEELYRIAKGFNLDIIKADFSRFIENNGIIEESNQKIAHNGMYNRVIYVKDELRAVMQNASLYTWSGIYNRAFLEKHHIRHNETPGASYQDNGFWFLTVSTATTIYFYDKVFYKLRRDNPNSSFFSKSKVYCIRDEYDYILNYITNNSENAEQILPYYWWARLGAYLFNLFRIAPEYRGEFLLHFQAVIQEADPYLNAKLFSKNNWKLITVISKDPSPENHVLQSEFLKKEGSASALNRLIWCYEDHGLIYTIGYLFEKVYRKFHRDRFSNLATKADISRLERQLNDRINRSIMELKLMNTNDDSSKNN